MRDVPATFSCPHCRAPLRLRHRPAGSLHLPCPDCGRPLELTDSIGELLIRPAGPAATSRGRFRPRRRAVPAALVSLPDAVRKSIGPLIVRHGTSPLVITWLAAGGAAALLSVAFLRSQKPFVPGPAGHPSAARETEPPESPSDERKRSGGVPPTTADESARPVHAQLDREAARPDATADARPPVAAPKPSPSPSNDPTAEVASRLAQSVLRFEQPKPVAFETLRAQIEEFAGVSVTYDASASDLRFREAEVRLTLIDVRIAAVLDEAARQAGLDAVIADDGVRLVPAAGLQAHSEPIARP